MTVMQRPDAEACCQLMEEADWSFSDQLCLLSGAIPATDLQDMDRVGRRQLIERRRGLTGKDFVPRLAEI
ncbi:hypothetical protein SAMN02927914_06285 [Mesorhizobium qingshengii]|uniref:Uncharacterized protein n=1 Tax=Mesorhizobium qingshengii TaxID=1165689 RepID=A0A1G5ZV19_9HYPH|nr:hypothetical protein SAMN02927914_06285 [Mesorhizobium qingshengii]